MKTCPEGMKSFLEATIRQAGALALEAFRRRADLRIDHKSVRDLVSEADVAVERFLKSELERAFPEFGFWGEESGGVTEASGRWIVDPIDGTLSFLRGYDYWSISIAVEVEHELQLGAVLAPVMGVLYWAEKGQGALKNGQPIQVSPLSDLSQAVVATGFACVRDGMKENNLPRYSRVVPAVMGTRIRGSAAIDLCMVAEGQIEAFWEQQLNLYDVAAGALIVMEAGGTLTDFQGQAGLNPRQVLASNGKVHPALLALMN